LRRGGRRRKGGPLQDKTPPENISAMLCMALLARELSTPQTVRHGSQARSRKTPICSKLRKKLPRPPRRLKASKPPRRASEEAYKSRQLSPRRARRENGLSKAANRSPWLNSFPATRGSTRRENQSRLREGILHPLATLLVHQSPG